ncbi:DUF3000 domain-containing protein [Sporichthya polymorpha]|uniref:DUF3000 domain-containing protein n=1 Tax=Sporichthya polymorpha TaxID=35751 RepID=UPI0003618A00|nr:DUF3000 domain-containing protein [Sporichthya polymorpha]
MTRLQKDGPPPTRLLDLPPDFVEALNGIQAARVRPEVRLVECPAPQQLAPYAAAVLATVTIAGEDVATGRLILLCDPAGQEAWEGRLRLVTYLRTTLEAEFITDPLLPEVAWGWLAETLAGHDLSLVAAGGTVTRVQSHPFGELADDDAEPGGELEIRASWSPLEGDLAGHVEAWIEVLCTACGLPPTPPGVVQMPGTSGAPRRAGVKRGATGRRGR